MTQIFLHENWKFKRTDEDIFHNATVPGSVFQDLIDNKLMEDPYYRNNEDKAKEFMNYDYEYITEFSSSSFDSYMAASEVFLRFEMVDTLADIYLNDMLLGSPNNMHLSYEYPVKKLLKDENKLRVVFHSPIKYIKEKFKEDPLLGTEDCTRGFPHLRKAHYMFGWDWGPRLADMGLQRPVSLLFAEKARLSDFYIIQDHSDGVTIKISGSSQVLDNTTGSSVNVKYTVTAPDSNVIGKDIPVNKEFKIPDPQLWWPNGYGDQPLYTVEIDLFDNETEKLLDSQTKRIGLRTMEISTEKDEYGSEFAHKVNGVKIFAMGADYIPQDNILPRVNKERTRTLLKHCKDSNFNCIRVWGGGYYPEDDFFDICDELGLVVWQDLMFACAVYRLTEDFERTITEEIYQNVTRIRHHASLGLWCGNNEMELFVGQEHWGAKNTLKSDYVKMYEYLFPRLLKNLDPQTFYWCASPSSGGGFDDPNDENRGDAHYWEVWHGNQPFTAYRQFHFRYLSEFGFQSFPSVKTIETFTEPKDRNIFSYVMEKHQRNNAANGKIMNYMSQTFLYPESLKDVVYYSQLLQAEAIKYGVEHFRRNRGRCMGTVYWQLNDCWPVASWASIDYYGRWKALQYYAKRFFAPLLISCEERGFLDQCLSVNDEIDELVKSIKIYVSNETMQNRDVIAVWQLRNSKAEILRQENSLLTVEALTSEFVQEEVFDDIDIHENYVSFALIDHDTDELLSEGTVLFCPPKHFNFADPGLTFTVNGDEITVSSSAYAKSVEIRNENDDLLLSDNYFDLNAESKTVKILSGEPKNIAVRSI
ncbi:beta-mannosidase [Butyrivibrio sp. MC2021]|uniref:beta-mannosidase n=1 Tax=Butyrivibrio sp. MC2021 TaxID=1408306 RepID=UPI00047AD44F|nr:glycoside hydrolase family 2 protein [Butyrivibrio sp. MC2021]